MKQFLKDCLAGYDHYVEIRHQEKLVNSIMARKGRVDRSSTGKGEGIGVRALVNGSWGMSATSALDSAGIKACIDRAVENAVELSKGQRDRVPNLSSAELAVKDWEDPGFLELQSVSLEDKIGVTVDAEKKLSGLSSEIVSSSARYNEIFESTTVVTTEGAMATRKLARPEFSNSVMVQRNGDRLSNYKTIGITGGWKELFSEERCGNLAEDICSEASALLSASYVEGGRRQVILSPSLVGLLCHEAIGHTVEADFVQSGSVAAGKLGQKLASEKVTLCDGGMPDISSHPAGLLPFDDEGVICHATPIIERGILTNYLHNRESAARFGVRATGNARAYSFSNEPLIRMTNTWMQPGEDSLEDMISGMKDGLLIEGAGGGQADATGEFMFGATKATEIKNGKRGRLFREVSLSGMAFEVLSTVDAVSSDFQWDLGGGYCGKGQRAKVDAGGPWLRCRLVVGGRQS